MYEIDIKRHERLATTTKWPQKMATEKFFKVITATKMLVFVDFIIVY